MRRILTIALISTIAIMCATTIVAPHCGSSTETADPTFTPTLAFENCLSGTAAVGNNPTTTTKSVPTSVYFTVGTSPISITVSDHGENRSVGAFLGHSCIRCFPTFYSPQFTDIGNNTTQWSQVTKAQITVNNGTEYVCAEALGTPAVIHHFERGCVAGACLASADYNTFPSTGCTTGFTNSGGTCTRSEQFQNRCADPSGYDSASCSCPDGTTTSPIVIDVEGSGFSMTGSSDGVAFNILNDGVPLQLSWTTASSGNAFLALDRNGNGTIDNGAELFGNLTPQPSTAEPNGFIALAEYDKRANGGDGNGRIDHHDSIFSRLKLWQDLNHNGTSEPAELRAVGELLSAIDLGFKESRRTDQYGNQFRYRAKVFDVKGEQAGRWAWDVFLVVQ